MKDKNPNKGNTMIMNTDKPSKAISTLIQTKMSRINELQTEALEACKINNVKELMQLQEELKQLSAEMMPHIKSSLIKKIIRERSNNV